MFLLCWSLGAWCLSFVNVALLQVLGLASCVPALGSRLPLTMLGETLKTCHSLPVWADGPAFLHMAWGTGCGAIGVAFKGPWPHTAAEQEVRCELSESASRLPLLAKTTTLHQQCHSIDPSDTPCRNLPFTRDRIRAVLFLLIVVLSFWPSPSRHWQSLVAVEQRALVSLMVSAAQV